MPVLVSLLLVKQVTLLGLLGFTGVPLTIGALTHRDTQNYLSPSQTEPFCKFISFEMLSRDALKTALIF